MDGMFLDVIVQFDSFNVFKINFIHIFNTLFYSLQKHLVNTSRTSYVYSNLMLFDKQTYGFKRMLESSPRLS